MGNKLYSEEAVQAIAAAIRAKDGDAADMTVAQMPARIAPLLAKERREVWLRCPTQRALPIDTGIAGDFEHTLEVVGYGNLYGTSALFTSVTASTSRQGVDLLTSTMKVRFVWGNSGLKTFEYPIETISCWLPMKIRFNKSGFTIDGFNRDYNAAQVTGDYGGSATGGGSTANYKIFGSITTSGSAPGVFRSAKIFDASDTLLHHLVPVLYNDWTLALLDKVTGTEQALATGANGYEAFWAPHADSLVNI